MNAVETELQYVKGQSCPPFIYKSLWDLLCNQLFTSVEPPWIETESTFDGVKVWYEGEINMTKPTNPYTLTIEIDTDTPPKPADIILYRKKYYVIGQVIASGDVYTCSGCVVIDTAIIGVYAALITLNSIVAGAEEGRVEAESARVVAENAREEQSAADHQRAGQDHTTATTDHGVATDDHTQYGADHQRAEEDHTTAGQDHTTAGQDHTTAGSDHTRAGQDHDRAEQDHIRAEQDHEKAVPTYRGTFNSVTDLGLTISATHAQIEAALGSAVSYAKPNDYVYVQIPAANDTPQLIARVEYYNLYGTVWQFVFELSSSGFTTEQWNAINSGITSGLVAKLSALPTSTDLQNALDSKYVKPSGGIPSTDMSSAVQTSLGKADTAIQDVSGKADKSEMGVSVSGDKTTITLKSGTSAEVINQHQDISGKQDVITDLSTIRSNAAAGKAASDALGGKTASDILNEAAAQAPKTEQKADQEIVFRKPNVTWDARAAFLKKLKGKTLAWNQLVNRDTSGGFSGSGLTGSFSNGKWNYTGAPIYEAIAMLPSASYGKVISGHKYYASIRGEYSAGSLSWVVYYSGSSDVFPFPKGILVPTGDSNDVEPVVRDLTIGVAFTASLSYTLVDLTLLYGSEIDGMTDAQILAKFEADYPGYHPYNPGELISNDAKALETVGFNLWDEEWEVGYISPTNGSLVENSDRWRTKNYIPVFPNTQYYIKAPANCAFWRVFFDANKNYIGYDIETGGNSNIVITTPNNACYMKFASESSYPPPYNHDICINISDASRNGQYEPYRKSVLPLNLDKIKVYSPNIWDEEWELGVLDSNGAESASDSQIRSKNYIPASGNADYYFKEPSAVLQRVFCYDANKTAIEEATYTSSGVDYFFKTAAGTKYIRFCVLSGYGTTYANDICINISDPAFNGRYFPHGVLTLEGGLKGNGTWADYIRNGKEYHRRANRVNLGDYNWSYNDDVFNAEDTNVSRAGLNAVCSLYEVKTWVDKTNKSIVLGWYLSNGINITDNDYNDTTAFKTAMDGVYLDYALVNEEVYELVEPIVGEYMVDKDGTERAITPLHTSDSPSAPLCADVQYGITPADSAVDAANMLKRWEYIQAQIDELNNNS